MKKVFFPALFLFINSFNSIAQEITVPSQIECAGIELHFTDALRKELQAEVNNLAGNPKYFQIKLQRAQQYFPIIEKIFREEGVPDDLKYLALQESALIADAVSSANAVGFWQFKEPTAREVGLTVNQYVDERMNIVAATRGAARYLKKNNFYFNNWMYAVISYQTGPGGADKYVERRYFGARRMELGKDTYWYLRRYIAHKIVYDIKLKNLGKPSVVLSEYKRGQGKTLNQIARDFNVEPDELTLYNKWLKSNRIPEDKEYAVIIPGNGNRQVVATNESVSIPVSETNTEPENPSPNMDEYPLIKDRDEDSRLLIINGIPGVIGKDGDDIRKLASLGSLPLGKFLKYNDITTSHRIIPGQVYYFKHKHNKAREYYHTVLPGQNAWFISQKYGIKLKKLLSKNRLSENDILKPGMVLWIRYIRPAGQEVRYVPVPETRQREVVAKTGENQEKNTEPVLPVPVPPTDTLPERRPEVVEVEFTRKVVDNSQEDISNAWQENVTDSIVSASPETPELPLFHVVQKGETLFGISKQYNVPIDSLMVLNGISPDAGIQIGQQLYLRQPPSDIETTVNKIDNSPESYTLYEVLKGDTMYSIARKFNVSVEDLQNWNNKSGFDLNVGEFLKIYQRK